MKNLYMKYWGYCFFILVIIWAFDVHFSAEIDTKRYKLLSEALIQEPSLRSGFTDYMADGKITNSEFAYMMKDYKEKIKISVVTLANDVVSKGATEAKAIQCVNELTD